MRQRDAEWCVARVDTAGGNRFAPEFPLTQLPSSIPMTSVACQERYHETSLACAAVRSRLGFPTYTRGRRGQGRDRCRLWPQGRDGVDVRRHPPCKAERRGRAMDPERRLVLALGGRE